MLRNVKKKKEEQNKKNPFYDLPTFSSVDKYSL